MKLTEILNLVQEKTKDTVNQSMIAKALNVDLDRINVKATTEEHLGFTGREEGIACEAVASIYR